MEHYTLQEDEVVICKAIGQTKEKRPTPVELLLTNFFFVFITKSKKLLGKEKIQVETFPVEDLKSYKNVYQIKQNDADVDMYFKNTEKSIQLESKKKAHQFVSKAIDFLTGKNAFFRGIDKTKKVIEDIDESLGIDSVGIANTVLVKGVGGMLITKLGKKKHKETIETLSLPSGLFQKKEKTELLPALSPDEQIEAVKKLKELLDSEIITQEEFDKKKKEIMGL